MSKLNFDQLTNLKLLLSIEGVGLGRMRNLLAHFKTSEEVLNSNLGELVKTEGINKQTAKSILKGKSDKEKVRHKLEKDFEYLTQTESRIITFWDDEYPPILKKIYDPPIILYAKGDLTAADQYCVAVVGTRQPTNYGKIQAEAIAGNLARQGITVVSGMARGIDSIAHNAALKNGGRTIAVIGSGLDKIYPPENRKLFEEITENGVVLSEYEPGTKPDAENFPKRNRIIAGISLGCVLVESGIHGGGMQTAGMALDQNREVFAIPGNIGVQQSEGTNLLIKKGEARLITTADDIISELELKLKPVLGKNIPRVQTDVSFFEQKILDAIQSEPQHIDKIAAMTEMTTSDCLVNLLSLEFKGLVKQLPGKMFVQL